MLREVDGESAELEMESVVYSAVLYPALQCVYLGIIAFRRINGCLCLHPYYIRIWITFIMSLGLCFSSLDLHQKQICRFQQNTFLHSQLIPLPLYIFIVEPAMLDILDMLPCHNVTLRGTGATVGGVSRCSEVLGLGPEAPSARGLIRERRRHQCTRRTA